MLPNALNLIFFAGARRFGREFPFSKGPFPFGGLFRFLFRFGEGLLILFRFGEPFRFRFRFGEGLLILFRFGEPFRFRFRFG
jgi:hypothetical protein